MRGVVTLLAVGLCLSTVVLTGSATTHDNGPTISEVQDRTNDVAQTVDKSRRLPLHLGVGVLTGLGVGLLVGSASMFVYWDRKLS